MPYILLIKELVINISILDARNDLYYILRINYNNDFLGFLMLY